MKTHPTRPPFRLEALVDFPDDALIAQQPLTPGHIDSMMATLAASGIRRVSWASYGDGHGGYFLPAGLDAGWSHYAQTLQNLENPLRVAVEAGHRHGLEVYGYFKPYETGPAMVFPEGSPEARAYGRLWQLGGYLTWLDPFVVTHPTLRIQRRTDDRAAGFDTRPICTIKLIKNDAAPTRLTQAHLQVWTSALNHRYQQARVAMQSSDTIQPAARNVRDANGRIITRKGEPVRVLTLSGLHLTDRYILVTTDFQEGPGDFENTGTDLMIALDEQGHEIPGVFATGAAIWEGDRVDFRTWGLVFDFGWGRHPVRLDAPNETGPAPLGYGAGRTGLIAFTRGRNRYLPGALCETEPAVQRYWLAWVQEMIDAGVDGVDIRVENHSTHTDYPEDYGFNLIILKRAARHNPTDPYSAVAQVRGEAYTDFLRQAKRLLASSGKRMRINLNLDYFRPDPPACRLPAYPANIRFEWTRWVEERLLDAGILRFFHLPFESVFEDEVARAMIQQCQHHKIPLCVNRYVSQAYHEEFQRVRHDGRFGGFVLYETASFLACDAQGGWTITHPAVEAICREMTAE